MITKWVKEGATRGSEEDPKAEYLHLFDHHHSNLEDEIHLKGGRIVTP